MQEVESTTGLYFCASRCTGKERDAESGLDNFEARYFGSSMGRFMSPDPEQIDGLDHMENPQSWNGYAYVHNNPLNATDPDGLDCVYLNNSGSGVESVDQSSSRGECSGDATNAGTGGYWVNGAVTDAQINGNSLTLTGTTNGADNNTSASYLTNGDTPLNSTAQGVFSQPIFNNAAGAVNFLGMTEYRAVGLFFPLTSLLVDQVAGTGSSGTSAGGPRQQNRAWRWDE